MQKFAKQKGFTAAGEKKAEKEYEVTIHVVSGEKAEETVAEEAEEIVCAVDSRKNGMVIVLSANVMGTGDEKLGTSLMKAFVFAVTKQDVLPETIVCYNTGAYLTCEGADTLEDMKILEAEGVNILTCGTCLDFYGIKDKLAVGSVTNMYEMFSAPQNDITSGYWLINSSQEAFRKYAVSETGIVFYEKLSDFHSADIRPVAYFDRRVKIVSGSGTKQDPYKVSK